MTDLEYKIRDSIDFAVYCNRRMDEIGEALDIVLLAVKAGIKPPKDVMNYLKERNVDLSPYL